MLKSNHRWLEIPKVLGDCSVGHGVIRPEGRSRINSSLSTPRGRSAIGKNQTTLNKNRGR